MRPILILTFCVMTSLVHAQFTATMELKEEVPGVCAKDSVFVLFPGFSGQVQSVCPVSETEILRRLNAEVNFLKDKPKYKAKGMVSIIINCEGEVVQCKLDKKLKDEELNSQIEAVFNTLGTWTTGKLNGEKVDSVRLFSFVIKKGKFYWE